MGSLIVLNVPSVGMYPDTPFPEVYQTWNSRQAETMFPSFPAQRQTSNNRIKNKNNEEEAAATSYMVPVSY